MPSLVDKSKVFLNKHSHLVDFLSGSIVISLCLVILLPKVHDSFQQVSSNSPHHLDYHQKHDVDYDVDENLVVDFDYTDNSDNSSQQQPGHQHQQHPHNHNHKLPIGELLICLGFFVFYCIGSSLSKVNYTGERQPLLMAKRKVNKYYVEEIRISRRHIDDNSANNSNNRQETNTTDNTTDPKWHLSAKVSLFAILLAVGLIIFDINIHGLMETIKVFRAAATGALLYLAFFVILPKTPDCNFCTKNDDDLFLARDIFAQEAQ